VVGHTPLAAAVTYQSGELPTVDGSNLNPKNTSGVIQFKADVCERTDS